MTWEDFKGIMCFLFVITIFGSCTSMLIDGAKQKDERWNKVATAFHARVDAGECKPFQQRADGYTTMFICGDIQVPSPYRY